MSIMSRFRWWVCDSFFLSEDVVSQASEDSICWINMGSAENSQSRCAKLSPSRSTSFLGTFFTSRCCSKASVLAAQMDPAASSFTLSKRRISSSASTSTSLPNSSSRPQTAIGHASKSSSSSSTSFRIAASASRILLYRFPNFSFFFRNRVSARCRYSADSESSCARMSNTRPCGTRRKPACASPVPIGSSASPPHFLRLFAGGSAPSSCSVARNCGSTGTWISSRAKSRTPSSAAFDSRRTL
mmetsp:Transcript_13561/g.33316  ORF Transcript_13561/g.33316 Transcript_13561/m.33316 type:complete len:243 (+) Transcript_13561:2839-3567(+)